MTRTYLDRKNVALAGTILRLRQSIDVYRVIGINATTAKQAGISCAFFGYVQQVSIDMITLTICKIFEYEKRNDPKKPKEHRQTISVHGVMARLAKHKYTPIQVKAVERFGIKYGNTKPCSKPTDYLNETINAFKLTHKQTLVRLRDYRNKHVAHAEFVTTKSKIKSLPSIDEFEAVFDFARDFYELISGGILNIGPALIGAQTGMGLMRTLKDLGLKDAQFDFPSKKTDKKK